METKNKYVRPEIEIIKLSVEDIITTSSTNSFDPDKILGGNAENWYE